MDNQTHDTRFIWLNEHERIVSFHSVEGYEVHILSDRDAFADFLLSAIERGYRFQ